MSADRPRSPQPAIVAREKARREQGIRLPEQTTTRVWFCRSCGAEAHAARVPHGWYSVTRHVANETQPNMRLGLYCSADCLDEQMLRIKGIEFDAGDDWAETAQFRQEITPGYTKRD